MSNDRLLTPGQAITVLYQLPSDCVGRNDSERDKAMRVAQDAKTAAAMQVERDQDTLEIGTLVTDLETLRTKGQALADAGNIVDKGAEEWSAWRQAWIAWNA